ncbi:MAG TPA: imelysin family protein [Candidatus Acidoferrum sp.]|nr:imelysin family protein [Candidatus Acidoferrum sp.]
MRRQGLWASTFLAVGLSAAAATGASAAPTADEVLASYADIAYAEYGDARIAAEKLLDAVTALTAKPGTETLAAARQAWKDARPPYMQTEGYRFGNAIVDDWEGKVNSWPLDEGLIDYVDPSYGESSDENPYYRANVIANPHLKIAGKEIDASKITPQLLSERLQEAGEVEANVATGYHAIEFLLWGQDLHGTGPGAGERPASDYDVAHCTHGNCDRRAAYLTVATQLLVSDLKEMEADWAPGGAARKQLAKGGPDQGLTKILTGLGSLSYGELAGERMKLGLMLHDPEQEHDCFSDNTHNSHYYDEVGMMNIYYGRYTRLDGTKVGGAGIADYVKAKAPAEGQRLTDDMDKTLAALKVIKDTADSGRMAYDQMIGPDNPEGNKMVDAAVQALVTQAHSVEAVVGALGLKIKLEGSDSLDNPSAVKTQ